MRAFGTLYCMFGFLSLLYYVLITCYAGLRTSFGWFFLLLGFFCAGFGIFVHIKAAAGSSIPVWIKAVFLLSVCIILVFLFLLARIVPGGLKEPKPKADYVIVLGAQVRGSRITKSLRWRLDAAREYLRENPGTKAVVSGGQGAGEDLSEAQAMEKYLMEKGIQKGRIIKEDRSTNTVENIRFSQKIIEEQGGTKDSRIVVVTNRFHVYRAIKISRKQGFSAVEGLGARTDRILFVCYYIRETIAVLKDWIMGSL